MYPYVTAPERRHSPFFAVITTRRMTGAMELRTLDGNGGLKIAYNYGQYGKC